MSNKNSNNIPIKIKYFNENIEKIKEIKTGDWIDLRAAKTIRLEQFEFSVIPLGIGMILPEGYEAHILPRSSTFKNFGILQVNSMGIIDNSYSGDEDQWGFAALAMRNTVIHENNRICQFRIVKNQPNISFREVNHLNENSRGGFGSTGLK